MPHNKKKNKKRKKRKRKKKRFIRVDDPFHSLLKEKKKELQKVGKDVSSQQDVLELGLTDGLELSEEEKRKLGIK